MPAASLERALTTFHAAPLREEHELKLYYVERPQSPLARIALRLRAQRRLKVLFTGHRITGKTTALNRLAADLGDAFFVVHFSVLDTLNAYDVHYADLMLALATRLFQRATDEGLFPKGVKALVKEALLEEVLLWLQKHTTGLGFSSTEGSEKSIGGKLNLLAVERR
jgi:MoxR-like ATPase